MSDPGSSGVPDDEAWLHVCAGMLEVFAAVADGPVPRSVLEQTLLAAGVPDAPTVIRLLIERQYLQVDPHCGEILPGPNLLALGRRLRPKASRHDDDAQTI